MTVVAVTSSRTSPGATSLAVGLATTWAKQHEHTVLIEADPAGGVLALRFGLAPTPSLTTFASDVRNGFDRSLVWSNTQDMRGVRCMPCPVDPRLARSWIERVAPTMVNELPKIGAPVVIDLGWVDEEGCSASIAAAADTTLIVTRPDIAEVQALLFQVRRLKNLGAEVGLVTVGSTPNNPHEVASLAGVPLVAVLPDDAAVAAGLSGRNLAGSKMRRSLLWRTIGGLASMLLDEATMYERAAVHAAASADFDAGVAVAGAAEFDAFAPGQLSELAPEALANAHPGAAAVFAPDTGELDLGMQLHAPPMPPVDQEVPAWAPPKPAPPAPAVDVFDAAVAVSAGEPVPPRPPAPPIPVAVVDTPAVPELQSPPVPVTAHDPAAVPAPVAQSAMPAVESFFDADDFFVADDIAPPATPHLETTTQLAEGPAALWVLGVPRVVARESMTILGRHSESDIRIIDPQASRHHGRLELTEHGWVYTDLGSRNGSRVNGHRCEQVLLSHGDRLRIGQTEMTFATSITNRELSEMECA